MVARRKSARLITVDFVMSAGSVAGARAPLSNVPETLTGHGDFRGSLVEARNGRG